jgi:hypothetical protein
MGLFSFPCEGLDYRAEGHVAICKSLFLLQLSARGGLPMTALGMPRPALFYFRWMKL